ncbi:MAG: phosphatase PAP2 family protein, partial [Fervidobacterium sp.]
PQANLNQISQINVLKEVELDFFHVAEITNYIISNPITFSSFIVFPFDEPLRKTYPKINFLNTLDSLEFKHFTVLTFLTSLIAYMFDPYTALTILESFTVTSLITITTKFIFGRARPYKEEGAFYFTPFNISEEYQSFPSGHSALSWSIFTPLALKYGDFWYLIPTVISAQRLWSDKHWTSDVLFGAAIGLSIGKYLYETREEQ